jgi:hypothetical protein
MFHAGIRDLMEITNYGLNGRTETQIITQRVATALGENAPRARASPQRLAASPPPPPPIRIHIGKGHNRNGGMITKNSIHTLRYRNRNATAGRRLEEKAKRAEFGAMEETL